MPYPGYPVIVLKRLNRGGGGVYRKESIKYEEVNQAIKREGKKWNGGGN